MILIVSNKWSKHIKDWWKDPSGSGVVSSVTIKAMSQDLWHLLAVYARRGTNFGGEWLPMEPATGPIPTAEWAPEKTPENMWRVKSPSRWCADWVRNAIHVHL